MSALPRHQADANHSRYTRPRAKDGLRCRAWDGPLPTLPVARSGLRRRPAPGCGCRPKRPKSVPPDRRWRRAARPRERSSGSPARREPGCPRVPAAARRPGGGPLKLDGDAPSWEQGARRHVRRGSGRSPAPREHPQPDAVTSPAGWMDGAPARLAEGHASDVSTTLRSLAAPVRPRGGLAAGSVPAPGSWRNGGSARQPPRYGPPRRGRAESRRQAGSSALPWRRAPLRFGPAPVGVPTPARGAAGSPSFGRAGGSA